MSDVHLNFHGSGKLHVKQDTNSSSGYYYWTDSIPVIFLEGKTSLYIIMTVQLWDANRKKL
jgi:hypothetical protein